MPTFMWPGLLWGLLGLPLLAVLYLRALRRRVKYPVAYSTLETIRRTSASSRRRHVAASLVGLSLAAIIVAISRPMLPLPVPADQAAIVLAIDISGSMRSPDIEPTRLEAAKEAARQFVEAMPGRVRIGLVVFGGFASLLAPPTTEHGRLLDLIAGLSTARRTAIGEGLLEAVAALPGRARPTPDRVLPPLNDAPPPGVVILLSDGRSNTGIDPLEAAEIARRQQVTVHAVGMGRRITPDNVWTIGGPLDEDTLQTIAAATGGTYNHASSARALHGIYRTLARQVGWERKPTEVSAVAAGLAGLLLVGASLVSWLAVPLRP